MKLFTKLSVEKYGFFTTYDNQNYILSYLHPETPYRSLFLCYEVGQGKTYAAACLAHIYCLEGFKTLYLSNSINSIKSFQNEYKSVVNDNRSESLEHNINVMSFTKFYRQKLDMNYGLVILDEVHNLRENANRYKVIKNKLDLMINSKLLIISATPMVDSVDEMQSILKLTNEDTKILFSASRERPEINYVGEKVNGEILFLSQLKGKQLEYYNSLNSSNDTVYTYNRQASISCNDEFDPNIPLEEQSSKVYRLIETLDSEKLTLVFCFYIKRGLHFIAKALEHIGYTKWNPLTEGKAYAIIEGNTSPHEVNEIMTAFNSLENIKGSKIHILIGSSVLSESITLYRVQHLHILSPFWNYGQIEQSIGRAIRINSHYGLKERMLNIYLHAAYTRKVGNEYMGIDIEIWKTAMNKKILIDEKLKEIKTDNINVENYEFVTPTIDNQMVVKYKNWIWDLRDCFEHNKYKISWCKFFPDKAVGYDLENKIKIVGSLPSYLRINRPLEDGYTIWRSCVDNKLRISYIAKEKKKFSKRGKLVSNVNIKELSTELGCKNSLIDIIETLKKQKRYFDKQIEYVV